jgi:hypothetical protein
MGAVRLLDVTEHLWLVVADAPLARYGEAVINRKLSDLDWVSRAAVAHEAIVESCRAERAVLPMKLFTIYTNDERALAQFRSDRRRIDALVARVAGHDEWGVRVVLDRTRALASVRRPARSGTRPASVGSSYLLRKKTQQDASAELATRAHETVAALYDRLAARARLAKRRPATQLPARGGPLLLDAAFLVPRTRIVGFQAQTAREARALERLGYRVSLTGPWPPYTFVQD